MKVCVRRGGEICLKGGGGGGENGDCILCMEVCWFFCKQMGVVKAYIS